MAQKWRERVEGYEGDPDDLNDMEQEAGIWASCYVGESVREKWGITLGWMFYHTPFDRREHMELFPQDDYSQHISDGGQWPLTTELYVLGRRFHEALESRDINEVIVVMDKIDKEIEKGAPSGSQETQE